ncbi:phytoene desaturase family protein [Fulvivirga maritima]|uniref:phytoene desaturase family protein n=1 Tax=Fulvivirga maritima TaxID=2904247 RepID=UPI001F211755|nr:phytoene desaturase family protein [Fulvivirga maritima]UII26581.1 phytoene desaturase family protein [Fulvivirga maritima]
MNKNIAVIGSGFAGLSAACSLAYSGHKVTVYEKNSSPGGRARKFETQGFAFDMGPSWYWMPDVFERFFNRFGRSTKDYYHLTRLDPSYRVYFGKDDYTDIPADLNQIFELFESLEKGSAEKLRAFLKEAAYKYEVGINDLVYKPGKSFTEFLDRRLMSGLLRLHVFNSISSYIRKFFKHPRLIQLLEFPVLFLGAMPEKTPALYSLMNYADISLGTWYPDKGMYSIIDGMYSLAKELGVQFEFNAPIDGIWMNGQKALGLNCKKDKLPHDYIVASADYNHVEQQLLPEKFRKYDNDYWNTRELAPSSLIFYLGVDKKIDNLLHHTLFFDKQLKQHAKEIYENASMAFRSTFLCMLPLKNRPYLRPEGKENLFILVPVAPSLQDNEEIREKYYNLIINRLETLIGQNIRDHVIFKKSYAHKNFMEDYNAFKGNAYGLANTLRQTAILKPSMHNKKVPNLIYTGQLTVPGPGVPPAIISGQVAAEEIEKLMKKL